MIESRLPGCLAVAVCWVLVSGSAPSGSKPESVLIPVADIPLPGGPSRFDYQSLDARNGRLFISHMGDGHLLVFDERRETLIADLPGFPQVTGVLFIPELDRVFASVAGAHEVAVIAGDSLRTVARIGGPDFPDGLAYDPGTHRVFVSDESGAAEFVIDADRNRVVARIPLEGEAGNTQFDAVGRRVYVAIQTRNAMAAIDPEELKVVAQYPLPGSEEPHGFYIDAPRRLMFVSCEGNARLLVVDMSSMSVTASFQVGRVPDVLAFDPGLRRLYMASESGVVAVFDERNRTLVKVGEVSAPSAHTVAVDPETHRVFLPLEDVAGRPVLRILRPAESDPRLQSEN